MTWGEFWLFLAGFLVACGVLVGLAVGYQWLHRQEATSWRDNGEGE